MFSFQKSFIKQLLYHCYNSVDKNLCFQLATPQFVKDCSSLFSTFLSFSYFRRFKSKCWKVSLLISCAVYTYNVNVLYVRRVKKKENQFSDVTQRSKIKFAKVRVNEKRWLFQKGHICWVFRVEARFAMRLIFF